MSNEPRPEVTAIHESISDLFRRMGHPQTRARLQAAANVELDKVSEVVLTIVARCSDADPRLSDLATQLGVELSSVSRKVQKLEDAGYLQRTTDPSDGRASRLHITASGQAVLDKFSDARQQLINEAVVDWSEKDRQQFSELLNRFLQDLLNQVESRSNQ